MPCRYSSFHLHLSAGNPQDVLKSISERDKLLPDGEPSLQNSLEMARTSMKFVMLTLTSSFAYSCHSSHLPSHSSREILILFGSLTTCDPGNIHDTVNACVTNKIRVSVVALAAEMKICRDLCEKTGGEPQYCIFAYLRSRPHVIRLGTFGVALNEGHFKDLVFEIVPPPAQHAAKEAKGPTSNPASDLLIMGFPTRLPDSAPPSLCVCHSQLKSHGFLCPRCLGKVCNVPTDCDNCGLMIVSSPHLARSYHHLFPVKAYIAQYVPGLDKFTSHPLIRYPC